MKIHQLPEGARFEYQGEEYVKTGPLLGTGKSGQRFIPKYAVLKPLDNVPPTNRRAVPEMLAYPRVMAAFQVFSTHCRELVTDERRGEFDSACRSFIDGLTETG